MTTRFGLARCAILFGAILLVAGAPSPLSAGSSGRVFLAALALIEDSYVKEVDIAPIALAGIRNLSAIDKEVAAELDASTLVLRFRGEVVLREPAPDARHSIIWGRLIERAIEKLQEKSEPIAAADGGEIQRVVFKGILSELDPESSFVGDIGEFRRNLGRIGVVFASTEGSAEVVSVLPGSPAQAAGIRGGDVLVQVDGRSTSGLALKQVLDLLAGELGSEITVTLERRGESAPVSVKMKRSDPNSFGILSALADGVLHLHVYSFKPDTPETIRREIGGALEGGLISVILDLRSSPGGLLDSGVEVADYFLGAGRIGSIEGRGARQNRVFESDGERLPDEVRVAILINGNTSGAAEVVADALQDRSRAVVVGSASRGKGTVQTVYPLPARAAIALTTAYIHSASGRRLEGQGVVPDLCTSSRADDPKPVLDALVERAGRAGPASQDAVSQREACPPSGEERDVDLAVARAVLRDPDLYRRAVR